MLAVLRVVKVLGEDGGDLSVRVGLEHVASLLEDEAELLVYGHETSQPSSYRAGSKGNSQLVMMPLWTTVNSFMGSDMWGWQLRAGRGGRVS